MLAELKGLHALLSLSPATAPAINSLLTQGSSSVQLGKIEALSELNDLPKLRFMGMICVCAIPVCGNVLLSNPGFSAGKCWCCRLVTFSLSFHSSGFSAGSCEIELFVTTSSWLLVLWPFGEGQ